MSQLNLTPQERRIVVLIFLVVIVVLNFLFVWPHFGEWGRINRELETMRNKIAEENHTIMLDRDPTNGWSTQVVKLARKEQTNGSVLDTSLFGVDPQLQLQNTIQFQQRKTGVFVQQYGNASVRTNDAFFEEHSIPITLECQESNLVNFLYNMGNDPAMIRVARLDLQPVDGHRYGLKGTMTLTANYAKKTPLPASASTNKPAAGTKPAVASNAKPPAASGARPAVASGNRPAAAPGFKPATGPGGKPPSGQNPPQTGGRQPPGQSGPGNRQGPPPSNMRSPNSPNPQPRGQPAVPPSPS